MARSFISCKDGTEKRRGCILQFLYSYMQGKGSSDSSDQAFILEEQHLRIENARLKDELDRVRLVAGKFLGCPISSAAISMGPPLLNSSLELGVGINEFGGIATINENSPLGPPGFGIGISSPLPVVPPTEAMMDIIPVERSMYSELALAAMDELNSTTAVISNGIGGTRNGALQLMHAELQVLSPLVPVPEVDFLRFCKAAQPNAEPRS